MQSQLRQTSLTLQTSTSLKCFLMAFFSPLFALLFALFLLFPPPALAIDAINSTPFGKLAIEGYDPVAYFRQNKAIKGSEYFETQWMGANWRFSSAENQALFRENPQQYAPQYGGYCAYAVSQNDIAGIKAELFTIHKGKLYLNYNRKINEKWRKNREQYIIDADRYWPLLLEKQ